MNSAQAERKSKKSKQEKQRLKNEQRKKRAEQARKRRKANLKKLHKQRRNRRLILLDICRAIRHHFPDLLERLSQGSEPRKRKTYEKEELLLGAIMMFVFRQSSRNELNNNRSEQLFAKNYIRALGVRLPHMDTVDAFLKQLTPAELEEQKIYMVKQLLTRRVLHKFRLFKKYFVVSVDATGLGTFEEQPYEGCLFRRYKQKQKGEDKSTSKDKDKAKSKGELAAAKQEKQKLKERSKAKVIRKGDKKVWFQPVLEAKLVCINGFSISIGTEWIINEGEWNKQDCELKAFKRLAEKLKKSFPRLSICIVADALYPNQSVFDICKQMKWSYILTLKDGQLKDVWQEVEVFEILYKENKEVKEVCNNKEQLTQNTYRWINQIAYGGHQLSWVECVRVVKNIKTGEEQTNRFVHLTNFEVTCFNVSTISQYGRLRWKIENEGFNTQKNGGYHLEHKFARKSLTATKNYFQALQIGHLINQLVELCHTTQQLLKGKCTIKHLWKVLIAFMIFGEVSEEQFMQQFEPTQFRYG